MICYDALARRLKDANKVLSRAKATFAGTRQEVQVLIAASQLYVEKGGWHMLQTLLCVHFLYTLFSLYFHCIGDFDSAIRMLDKIGPDSPIYGRAQLVKADIFLNHNHDKEGFTKCYRQLAERFVTIEYI